MSPGKSSPGSRSTVASPARSPSSLLRDRSKPSLPTSHAAASPWHCRCHVHPRLLVAALDERQVTAELVQCLTQPSHVSVAEDSQRGRDQPTPMPVGHRILPGQVRDDGLGHGQPYRASRCLSLESNSFCYHGRPCRMIVLRSVIFDGPAWPFLADSAAFEPAVLANSTTNVAMSSLLTGLRRCRS